jgi:hypothetical protein
MVYKQRKRNMLSRRPCWNLHSARSLNEADHGHSSSLQDSEIFCTADENLAAKGGGGGCSFFFSGPACLARGSARSAGRADRLAGERRAEAF